MDHSQKIRFILILIYMVALAAGSLLPISIKAAAFSGSDKLMHCALYAPLGFLLSQPNRFSTAFLNVMVPLVFGSFYGALLEVLQTFVSGRDASGYDAVANVLGVGIGITVSWGRGWMKGKTRARK